MTNFYTPCFWALLSSEDFRFFYLAHSAAKINISQDKSIADLLVNRSLLDFIHPDEKNSAQIDLGKFQNSSIPAGSITRCRLSSFQDIAFEHYGSSQELGAVNSTSPTSGWDIVDVVMYIVTETIILAFFHNLEYFRRSGAAQSQCGELTFETREAARVFDLLNHYIPIQPSSSVIAGTTRLFQIHHGSQLQVSWPHQDNEEILEAIKNVMLRETSFCDGNRCIKNTTECTHHHHSSSIAVLSTGMVRIERIIIPYGQVIFAAFNFTPVSTRPSHALQTYYKHYVHCNPTTAPVRQETLVYASHSSSTIDLGSNHHPPTFTSSISPATADVPTGTSGTMSIEKLLHNPMSSSTSTRTTGDRLSPLPVTKLSATVFPMEARVCAKCHTHSSPEWRKGPSGNKTLCNACGLRFSRFIAKQKRLSRNVQQHNSSR